MRAGVGNVGSLVRIVGDVANECDDDGRIADNGDGDAVAILNVEVACNDVTVRGVSDEDDGDAVAIPDVGDVCDDVDGDAVAILKGEFASDDVGFVIADGGDARANDAGAVGMGRGSGTRPRRLPILILRIVFFRKLVGM